MSKTEELKITMNNNVWEPKGIIGNYISLCISGLGTGAVVGGYIGATVGLTTALASPGIIGYGLFRAGRKLLRR
jgi:hypothetical protein